MKDQNFTATFTVEQSPKQVFDAINNVRGWWSENIEGSTTNLGDQWTYRYKDAHCCTMKITEMAPNKKVVWHVLDNYFNFTQDKTEWKGTDVVFELAKKGDKTEVRFTHVGLVSAYECYDVCSNAWGSYVNGSLRNLITTGKGNPTRRNKDIRSNDRKQKNDR
jgi:Activator of Hsp90 ATPase homolog 1-like protein